MGGGGVSIKGRGCIWCGGIASLWLGVLLGGIFGLGNMYDLNGHM